MLQFENITVEITAIGPVARKMGNSGEYEHGMFVAMHVDSLSADHLDEMEKGLRKSLYKKVSKQRKKVAEEEVQSDMLPERADDLTQPRYAGKMKSFPWDDILDGYTLSLGSGLTATKPRVFEKVQLKNFKIAVKDGGTISLGLSAIVDCDREHKGWLCEQLRGTLQLSLIPPGSEQTEIVVDEESEEEEYVEE
jgi:hypothetical protein